MAAYLTQNPPVRPQWYARRSRPLTGCTVLHTAESVMDSVGPDTGAENVANFIRTRTTAGSYHDLVDSDSALQLVEYDYGAFHDGTGSNNWALSLSFALRTSDWPKMGAAKRNAFLRQGAIAFARQQAYRRSIGAPLTELRLISKAQSDRGESGFTYHGLRDPGRRSDPGVAPPNLFPIEEFIAECRAVLSGEEDDMPSAEEVAAAVWRDYQITGRDADGNLRGGSTSPEMLLASIPRDVLRADIPNEWRRGNGEPYEDPDPAATTSVAAQTAWTDNQTVQVLNRIAGLERKLDAVIAALGPVGGA